MTLLISCCGITTTTEPAKCVFEHPVVMCCLIWALVVLVMSILFYCYKNKKAKLKYGEAEKVRKHEEAMKNLAFDQEKYWFFQKRLEPKFENELKDKINELKKEKDNLSTQLKEEKDNREKTLKEERLQAERDFYEKVLSQFFHIEENQSNKQ